MAEPFATVRDLGPMGMVTLRGSLADQTFADAVGTVAGVFLPEPNRIAQGQRSLAWMSPDELLLILPRAEAAGVATDLTARLSGQHALVADVSDARSVIAVDGPGAAEVLAKLSPADLHPDRFPVGTFRRSRLGQVAAAFWRHETGFTVVCFRSVGAYVLDLLTTSAHDGAVGVFRS